MPAFKLDSVFTPTADQPKAIDAEKAKRFVLALQEKEGGFIAGLWDDAADVEYTFYGLGSLALLSGPASGAGGALG